MSHFKKDGTLKDDLPAKVEKVMTGNGLKYGLKAGHRRLLLDRREAECVYADLMLLLGERESHAEV